VEVRTCQGDGPSGELAWPEPVAGLVAAGVLIAREPQEAVAAPATTAAARITPTVVGGSLEKIYY
jgi:hypothetical protein